MEAIVVMLFDYKVKFSGGDRPNISIFLSKETPLEIRLMTAEFARGIVSGQTKVKLSFSTDELAPSDQEKLAVVVSIEGNATEYQKSVANKTEDGIATCVITSYHPANVVKSLLRTCEGVTQQGGKVPVIIKTNQGNAVCVLAATEVSVFSWKEKFRELQFAQSEGAGPVN